MTNQYRLDTEREVIVLVDCGRLMAAPLGDASRLDVALDTALAVAASASEFGDRCGLVAFDDRVRLRIDPARRGAGEIARAVFDLQPRPVESDYELAFTTLGARKRALAIVLCDLLDERAAAALVDALPVLRRRHAVIVVAARDPALEAPLREQPTQAREVYAATVALGLLRERAGVVRRLARLADEVVTAPPSQLAAATVRAYLRVEARARA